MKPQPKALSKRLRATPVRALRPVKNGVKYVTARLEQDDIERLALLRAKLNLDSSSLFHLALGELYARRVNVEPEKDSSKREADM